MQADNFLISYNKVTISLFRNSGKRKTPTETEKVTVADSNSNSIFIETFTVPAKSKIFIKGASSSGKTVIINFLQAHRELDNTTLSYPCKKKSRGSVLTVDYHPHLLPRLTLMDNIFISLGKPTIRQQNKAIEMLHLFNIAEKRDVKADALSHTEKLKTELIRAVMLLPALLLTDDYDLLRRSISAGQLHKVLNTITENGGSVVATGSDHDPAFDVCYEINAGRLSCSSIIAESGAE